MIAAWTAQTSDNAMMKATYLFIDFYSDISVASRMQVKTCIRC
jgi:hypothetical protein